jgi:glycosyltransferase involved in cell wall biosynthesis
MSNKNTPLITIGLTTFNRPDFLKESVQSILKQNYKNFRLIIGNDYPESKVTFKTLGIEYDSRIEIINFKENIGEINNLNYLLSQANSEWFTWLADDDLLNQSFLESLIENLNQSNQNVCAIYSEYAYGEVPDQSFFDIPNQVNSIQLSSRKFIFKYVERNIRIIGTCGLINTQKLKMIGGFPNLNYSSGIYGDALIPILLAKHGNINIVNFPLVFLRTHKASLSASLLNFDEYISAEPNFLIELSKVCLSIGDEAYRAKCIFHMVSWFTDNEFVVLSRVPLSSKPLSFFQKFIVLIKLLIYQIKVNYPKIKIRYWLLHTFHIIKILISYFCRILSNLLAKL